MNSFDVSFLGLWDTSRTKQKTDSPHSGKSVLSFKPPYEV